MKTTFPALGLMALALTVPAWSQADDHTDSDRAHPKTFFKDAAITTKIKAKLENEHLSSIARIHVDTDDHGVVVLTGYVHSRAERERAAAIARETEGVTAVRDRLRIKKDD